MKVTRTFSISADVDRAISMLSEKHRIPKSEIIEFMFYKLGGFEGLDKLLAEQAFKIETGEKKEKRDTLVSIIESMVPLWSEDDYMF